MPRIKHNTITLRFHCSLSLSLILMLAVSYCKPNLIQSFWIATGIHSPFIRLDGLHPYYRSFSAFTSARTFVLLFQIIVPAVGGGETVIALMLTLLLFLLFDGWRSHDFPLFSNTHSGMASSIWHLYAMNCMLLPVFRTAKSTLSLFISLGISRWRAVANEKIFFFVAK